MPDDDPPRELENVPLDAFDVDDEIDETVSGPRPIPE